MTSPATESAPPRTDPTDTREKILDAAEALIIEHGFSATSLRAIATRASVNLAATHYHFGSKKGLLAAVFHRRIDPINQKRLFGLKELRASERPLTVKSIVEVFLAPFNDAASVNVLPGIVGRILGEPESLTRPMLEQEFAEVVTQFHSALVSILPGIGLEEVQWRFHFMVGSMIYLLQVQSPLGIERSHEKFIFGLTQLTDFCIAGLEQAGAQTNAQPNAMEIQS